MHASSDFCPGKSAAGRGHRYAVLAWVLVVPLWILSMQSAFSQQNDLAALNQRVIQLHQAGHNAEAILLAEKAVIDLKPFAADAKKGIAKAVGDLAAQAPGFRANAAISELRLVGVA